MARGDSDALSDVDVLAVVKNNEGKVSETDVTKYLPKHINSPTISWYGLNRLKGMFCGGELFAWHIFLESKELFDSGGTRQTLGVPAQYSRAIEDIAAFRQTLKDVPNQLKIAEYNAIYELGVLYVCVRNIAMSASWHLCQQPDFSRMSPYRLGKQVPACPLPIEEYERSMSCRMASQRGLLPLAGITANEVLSYYMKVSVWADTVLETIAGVQDG